MKKNFGFDAKFNKMKLSARSLWMGFERGEGELEIENQGRFDQSRFSQETEAIGQQTPRIGEDRPKLRFTQRVSSAGCTLNSDSTPHFSFQESTSALENSNIRFPLRAENNLARMDFTLPSTEIQLAKTQNEQATMAVASKTQNRLASLLKAASRDEDSAV